MQVIDRNAEVLLASQFTLFARTVKGTKPDFHLAMPPSQARPWDRTCLRMCTQLVSDTSRLCQAQDFYALFVESMRSAYKPSRVHDGVFGAMVDISLVNEGPVTIIFDSDEPRKNKANLNDG